MSPDHFHCALQQEESQEAWFQDEKARQATDVAETDAEHVEPTHKAEFNALKADFVSNALDELDHILQACKDDRNCITAASFTSKVSTHTCRCTWVVDAWTHGQVRHILSEYRDKLLVVQPAALDSTFQSELLQRRMAGAALLQTVSTALVTSGWAWQPSPTPPPGTKPVGVK